MKNSSRRAAWDVLVIGGGPAGMMTAATAAARGKRVLLLEKNSRVGKKLLITGGGRCNILNNKPEVRVLAAAYKDAKKFLYSTFSQHAAKESIDWFRQRGVTLVEENDGRLFPSTNTAQTVWDVLVSEMKTHQVAVRSHAVVMGITKPTKHVFQAHLQGGEVIDAPQVVLATGGMARPETGSTGDGFRFLSSLGHTVLQQFCVGTDYCC
jgi:predicted Rossmann fold flavoprotein